MQIALPKPPKKFPFFYKPDRTGEVGLGSTGSHPAARQEIWFDQGRNDLGLRGQEWVGDGPCHFWGGTNGQLDAKFGLATRLA